MALEIELQELLREPRERLDVELKNWLDITQGGSKGTLAKALLALANHGGGFVLIGFEDDGTVSSGRPGALDAYIQDRINDVVDRFADPGFHCAVHHVVRSVDSLVYPVIVVPGGHKVPIRSKRGSEGNEIQRDKYYIRRPGPASESPQSGHEWDELMRRCLRGHSDEIASLMRGIMEGRAPKAEAKPDSAALLEEWQAKSMARWNEVTAGLPPDNASRFPRGWYSVSCLVEGVNLPLQELREALQTASQVRLTGWTPWWQPTRQELAPYPHDDTIECWLGHDGAADAAHSDFWRVSTAGQLFLIRGYNEDSLQSRGAQFSRVEPGKYFDLTLPVWRIAECLLYVARFAAAVGATDASVVIRVEWTGLRDRILTSLDRRRTLLDGYRAASNARISQITVPAERINTALPEILRDLTAPLFVLFGFFTPGAGLYSEEIDRLVNRTF